MRLFCRAGLAALIAAGSAVLTEFPSHLAAWMAPAVAAAADDSSNVETSPDGSGEIWITAQNSSQLIILGTRDLRGTGETPTETIVLPRNSLPHTVNFSPSGRYAYVSNLGTGDLIVVRAQDRQIVARVNLGAIFMHETAPSPDGTVLLSANPLTGLLTKITADENTERWAPAGSLNLLGRTGQVPVCTVFSADGKRAYASLGSQDIAVVDVESMTLLATLPTIGTAECNMVNSKDATTIFVASNGGTGHFYRVDTTTDTITEDTRYGPIGLGLHYFALSVNEKAAFIAARNTDEIKVLDLNRNTVDSISVDLGPRVSDAPDGVARRGNDIFVTLRFAGQVARINAHTREVEEYISLVPPATSGYPLHGITIRPHLSDDEKPNLVSISPEDRCNPRQALLHCRHAALSGCLLTGTCLSIARRALDQVLLSRGVRHPLSARQRDEHIASPIPPDKEPNVETIEGRHAALTGKGHTHSMH